jgi:hypothetical protein
MMKEEENRPIKTQPHPRLTSHEALVHLIILSGPKHWKWHPTAVVVQTPVIEWVRWLDALAEFIKWRD